MADLAKESFAFVTLTYNHAKYIIEHLESIKYQVETHGADYDVCLVIADDHSRDDTLQLARRWIARNPGLFARATILENERNSGTCANYVKALNAVGTNWFKFLAGDDVYAFSDIFSLVRMTEKHSFVSGIPLMLEGRSLSLSRALAFNMVATDEIYRERFEDAMHSFSSIHTPSLAYGRELVDDDELKKFILDYALVEDFAMQIKACELHPELRYLLVPEIYVYYRRTSNSTYIIKNDKFLDDKRRLFEYLMSRESSCLKKALLRNRIICLGMGNGLLKMIVNLNAYVYFCNVVAKAVGIVRRYSQIKIDVDAHKSHYMKIKDRATSFVRDAGGADLSPSGRAARHPPRPGGLVLLPATRYNAGSMEEDMFRGKTLLITGGTGSFGNAVLDRFLDTDIGEIRIFSRDEKKQDDMRHRYKNDKIKFYIGDVRDFDSINSAMRGVDYVFSAAALKQVPSCEFYPIEAVKTNVMGTSNTLDAAVQNGVKRVVVLSTDKAVYPINAMGMSKAMMEKVMQAKSRNLTQKETMLCGTRYGNVMASRGSVIPLFIKQIKNNLPITVTNPEMTRFMMSLPQAVELVLFAFSNANQGDMFVQKAPAATIEDLAWVLRDIFEGKNEIRVIGTRHGEKVYETLLSKEEAVKAVDMGDYYRVPADTRDLNYALYFDKGDEKIGLIDEYNSHNTRRLDREGLRKLLLDLDYVQKALKGIEGEGV